MDTKRYLATKVLIVEDDKEIIQDYKFSMGKHGEIIREISDVSNLHELDNWLNRKTSENYYFCFIVDLQLSVNFRNLDGLSAIMKIRTQFPNSPIIVCSNRREKKEDVLRIGANFFFDKTIEVLKSLDSTITKSILDFSNMAAIDQGKDQMLLPESKRTIVPQTKHLNERYEEFLLDQYEYKKKQRHRLYIERKLWERQLDDSLNRLVSSHWEEAIFIENKRRELSEKADEVNKKIQELAVEISELEKNIVGLTSSKRNRKSNQKEKQLNTKENYEAPIHSNQNDLIDKSNIPLHNEKEIQKLIINTDYDQVLLINVDPQSSLSTRCWDVLYANKTSSEKILHIAYTNHHDDQLKEKCFEKGVELYFHDLSYDYHKTVASVAYSLESFFNSKNNQVKNWETITDYYCYIRDVNREDDCVLLHCEPKKDRSQQSDRFFSLEKFKHLEPLYAGKPILIRFLEDVGETHIKFKEGSEDFYPEEEEIDFSDLDNSSIFESEKA